MQVTVPLTPYDLVASHPLRTKSQYFGNFALPILRALQAIPDIKLQSPKSPQGVFCSTWNMQPDIKTGFCYSDYPAITGWEGVDVDLLFKLKYHPTRVRDIDLPVFPGGFIPGGPLTNLTELRETKDNGPKFNDLYFTQMTFREITPYPNRAKFARHPLFQNPPPTQRFNLFLENVASYVFMLNLCGNGFSIDRKVVDACSVGTAIISDRGLEDLVLPYGERFVHGENIWFIDEPEEVKPAMAQIRELGLVAKLTEGSRALYDTCFSPESLGAWYLKCTVDTWSS